MKTNLKDGYAAQASVIKAMAHPTRLLILNSLKKREICVCDLRDLAGGDISTVSKHLLVLRNAGLVASRREGTRLLYRLTCPCVLDFTACIGGLRKKNV